MDISSKWMKHLMDDLKGIRIRRSKWVYEDWDHDHCEICSAKIDVSTEIAYCTEDYGRWICDECYAEFKKAFEWVLVDEPESE